MSGKLGFMNMLTFATLVLLQDSKGLCQPLRLLPTGLVSMRARANTDVEEINAVGKVVIQQAPKPLRVNSDSVPSRTDHEKVEHTALAYTLFWMTTSTGPVASQNFASDLDEGAFDKLISSGEFARFISSVCHGKKSWCPSKAVVQIKDSFEQFKNRNDELEVLKDLLWTEIVQGKIDNLWKVVCEFMKSYPGRSNLLDIKPEDWPNLEVIRDSRHVDWSYHWRNVLTAENRGHVRQVCQRFKPAVLALYLLPDISQSQFRDQFSALWKALKMALIQVVVRIGPVPIYRLESKPFLAMPGSYNAAFNNMILEIVGSVREGWLQKMWFKDFILELNTKHDKKFLQSLSIDGQKVVDEFSDLFESGIVSSDWTVGEAKRVVGQRWDFEGDHKAVIGGGKAEFMGAETGVKAGMLMASGRADFSLFEDLVAFNSYIAKLGPKDPAEAKKIAKLGPEDIAKAKKSIRLLPETRFWMGVRYAIRMGATDTKDIINHGFAAVFPDHKLTYKSEYKYSAVQQELDPVYFPENLQKRVYEMIEETINAVRCLLEYTSKNEAIKIYTSKNEAIENELSQHYEFCKAVPKEEFQTFLVDVDAKTVIATEAQFQKAATGFYPATEYGDVHIRKWGSDENDNKELHDQLHKEGGCFHDVQPKQGFVIKVRVMIVSGLVAWGWEKVKKENGHSRLSFNPSKHWAVGYSENISPEFA